MGDGAGLVLDFVLFVTVLSLPVALVSGLGWAIFQRSRSALTVGTLAQSTWIGLGGLALAVYARGTEGGSALPRIQAQDAAPLTFSALLLTAVAITMLAVARRTERRDLAVAGFLCSAVAVLLLLGGFAANGAFQFE